MPKALDLFCGAGGVAKGLQLAGFVVHGIDIKPQPRYCGEGFTQADAMNHGADPLTKRERLDCHATQMRLRNAATIAARERARERLVLARAERQRRTEAA